MRLAFLVVVGGVGLLGQVRVGGELRPAIVKEGAAAIEAGAQLLVHLVQVRDFLLVVAVVHKKSRSSWFSSRNFCEAPAFQPFRRSFDRDAAANTYFPATVGQGMMRGMSKFLLVAGAALLASAAAAQPSGHAAHHPQPETSAMFQTPQSIAAEHRELHEVLAGATREPGQLGEAARGLEAALAPHFKREEQIATPPLGLLDRLAHGPATAEMREVLPMTDALEAELPKMLKEHEGIKAAAAKFRAAAVAAKRDDYVRFADTLAAHALQEEQILYPAAIVIGRYVKATAPAK